MKKLPLPCINPHKPRIKLDMSWPNGQKEWVCYGGNRYRGYGPTPELAYAMWLEDLIPF